MLQWMGGSRRKVNSSRNSVQKRQKQYFEQKRRQQQKTAETQTNQDRANSNGQHQEEQRSLDILSLLNVQADNRATLRPAVKRMEYVEANAPEMKNRSLERPPLFNTGTPVSVVDFDHQQGATSSQYCVETKSPNKILPRDPDRQISSSKGINDKSNVFRTPTEQQFSVLDLLLDDEPNGMPEEITGHEPHVAFSVEGLGKVGTETPVHSPQQPGRIFPHGCHSSLNGAMKPNSLKNRDNVMDELELQVKAMIQDIDMAVGVSSFDGSMNGTYPSNNLKQKLSTVKRSNGYDCHGQKTKGSLYDGYNIASNDEDIWEGSGRVLDDGILEEMKYDLSRENWSYKMDGTSANPLEYRDHEMPGYNFEGPLLKKRNIANATDRFNISEPQDPYSKYQIPDDYYNCNMARHPCERWTLDFGEVTDPRYWTSLAKENERDSLNFQSSDESCSSSAVFGGEAYHDLKSYSRSRDNWRRYGRDVLGSHMDKNSVKNLYARETQYDQEDIQLGHNVHISRNHVGASYPSKSKPWNHSGFPVQEKVDSLNGRLFEEGFTLVDAEPGLHSFSFSGTSDAKVRSSRSKHWTDNNPGEFPAPESHDKSSGKSKLRTPNDCPSSCSSFSRKSVFDQPFTDLQFFKSPVSTGPTKADLSPDCAMDCNLPGSSHISGSNKRTRMEGSFRKEEKPSEAESFSCGKFKLGEEFNTRNNSSSSENGRAMVASNSKGNDSEGKDTKKVSTGIKKNVETTDSADQEEDITSSMKTPSQSDWNLIGKEYQQDTKNPLPSQSPCKDVGVIAERMGGETCGGEHQVLMLERYVIHLLRVQKKLKEDSAQNTLKKE